MCSKSIFKVTAADVTSWVMEVSHRGWRVNDIYNHNSFPVEMGIAGGVRNRNYTVSVNT